MLMDEEQAAEAGPAAAAAGGEPSLEEFLLTMHRLSVALSERSAFTSQNVSLSEWAILKSLGEAKDVPLRQFERTSGLSRQRIRVLLAQLQKRNLVSVSQSTEGDKRVRTVSVLPAAHDVVAAISAEIAKLSGGYAGQKQARSLTRAIRFGNQLVRTIRGKRPKRAMKAKKETETEGETE